MKMTSPVCSRLALQSQKMLYGDASRRLPDLLRPSSDLISTKSRFFGIILPYLRLTLLLQLIFSAQLSASESPLIGAASGFRFALKEISNTYTQKTGVAVRTTLASSGKLLTQIKNGAPFEIFISADMNLIGHLVKSGAVQGEPVVIAHGRLALVVPLDSPIEPDAGLKGLAESLERGEVSRFSIASPQHAPYGQRAVEVLQKAGLWDRVEDKLVVGENVAQATQFVFSGAAQGGIVALSLLEGNETFDRYRYVVLPETWHKPLVHGMVLLKKADQATMDFYNYLKSEQVQIILSRYGYR